MVRAKFAVTELHAFCFQGNRIKLVPHYDDGDEMSPRAMSEADHMKLVIDDPAILKQLPLGQKCYVDFTPID